MTNFPKTQGEQPGPVELIPATKTNPAVYSIHRNLFQHCKSTVAHLGCSTVINISSRRLFLKTAAIRLENIQFDSVNEPYDEAISTFMRYAGDKPRSVTKGNVLVSYDRELFLSQNELFRNGLQQFLEYLCMVFLICH